MPMDLQIRGYGGKVFYKSLLCINLGCVTEKFCYVVLRRVSNQIFSQKKPDERSLLSERKLPE